MEHAWVVAFINPRCGVCTRFVPHFTALQQMDIMKNRKIKFAYVDATLEENKAGIL